VPETVYTESYDTRVMIQLEHFLHYFGLTPPLLVTVVVAAAAVELQQPAAAISADGELSPHSLAVVGADDAAEVDRSPTVVDMTGQSFAGSFYLAYR
jgi:hypothetical protein